MSLTETTVWRAQQARSNEELVQAENALRGERIVCFVRIALFTMIGLSQGVIRTAVDQRLPDDAIRGIAIASYIIFSFTLFFLLRSIKKPDPKKARTIPLAVAVVDFAFPLLMAARTFALTGDGETSLTSAHFGVLITFSVARMGLIQVAWSVGLACIGFVGLLAHTGNFSPVTASFVVVCYVALGILIGWTNRATHEMFVALRKRDNLGRFLPQQIVERVLRSDGALRPTQREVSVLFSDIRSFTTISERMAPAEVLALLDEYFSHMTHIVKGHDGIVNKFLGDGMLAFWGVPDRLDNHAELAVKAALDMRRKLDELNAHWVREGRVPLKVGIGIHTGMVAAGMLGGADQHEYTVIGDAVNVASRVEGLTKAQGVDVLVTEETWRALGGRYRGERIGEEHVKGREKPVVLYAIGERIHATQAVSA